MRQRVWIQLKELPGSIITTGLQAIVIDPTIIMTRQH